METDNKTLATAGAPAAPPSLLERLQNQLLLQDNLLSDLESRLRLVSDRLPSEDIEPHDSTHLATLLDYVERNNGKIQKLINELVI